MAWTSMHFAVGMCGGAAVMAVHCLIRGRGWRHLPLAMTLGGIWANVPDMPRLWRVDFPGLPFAGTLGSMDLEHWLHSIGNLFFMHRALDAQPKEFALLGLAGIIGLYNLCLIGMWWHGRQLRNKIIPRHAGLSHLSAGSDTADRPPAVNQAVPKASTPPPLSKPHSFAGIPIIEPGTHTSIVSPESQENPVAGRIGSR